MIESICHIGPALNVQGGISSVLVCYKKLFGLQDKHFISTYNGSFVKSLPLLLVVCLKLLLVPPKWVKCYQIHTSADGSFFRKFLVSLCLRLRGKKYTILIHGSRFDFFCNEANFWVRKMLRQYFEHAARVLVLSSEMKTIVKRVAPDFDNFETIPNPGAHIAQKPADLASHNLPVKIVFSGRYGQRKGVYDLLQAFEKAAFKVPVHLYLFGDGEVQNVMEIVEKSAKKENITVSPWLKHSEYLKKLPEFDLLVLPSYAERFSMSLVEALGMGLPVISTFVGGTSEVVEDGVCGILHQPGDVNGLVNAMEKMVNDEGLRYQMGVAGWNRVSSNFSGEVVLNKLECMYKDICG